MRSELAAKKHFWFTIVTTGNKPDHHAFWFSRKDMSDNLKPIKVEAKNLHEAWVQLDQMEKSKC